ncbi:iron ABC transporter permease [Actinomyces sp. HMSC06A08]|uniref:Iron ABC transporter permease n=1 Tax=Winkia neuii TaxID=33007 RepID=A0A2I1INL3_9ACTO|nr:iron ABC transporter permease [Actinomyces sp. HMSC064C12]OFK01196.1 iron ABC transporter permease [Actinomyces sp. HMSC072A03]OFT55763.1 iron ABC transporter permease [Actinomyces sp. HMSC06A08]PKY72713.1 iron ABC transporter permease [Winkia neuii]
MPERQNNFAEPRVLWLGGATLAVLILVFVSIVTGAAKMSLGQVLTGQADLDQLMVLTVSRLPRTLALLLAGSAMAVAGLVMQLMVQNRYVEPATTGVTESAGLGVLVAVLFFPTLAMWARMLVAVCFALAGTALLMGLVSSLRYRDPIVVPLLGIVLSGIIGAASTFLAWQFEMQGMLNLWLTGDFSGIIKGRYELLWVVAAMCVLAYLFADTFTVVGLGKNFSESLGVSHRAITALGLAIVATVAGVSTVVTGTLPFLGLIVPNLTSLILGDYMRRSLPLVALGGAFFVLVSDIIGRTLIAPAEIPVGVVMGVIGAAIFIGFLLKTVKR